MAFYVPNALESPWASLDVLYNRNETDRDVQAIFDSFGKIDVIDQPAGRNLAVASFMRGPGLVTGKSGVYSAGFRRVTVERIQENAANGKVVMREHGVGPFSDQAWVYPKQRPDLFTRAHLGQRPSTYNILSATSVSAVKNTIRAAGGAGIVAGHEHMSYGWVHGLMAQFTLVILKDDRVYTSTAIS